MSKNKNKIEFNNLFNELISDIATSMDTTSGLSVIDFAETLLFNNQVELFPQQKALIKSFYNEPLDPLEQSILHQWTEEDRTTWIRDRKYRNLVVEAGRGGGKALAINTLIPTPNGWTIMKDISKGDLVYSPQGEPIEVTATTPILYNHKVYKLTFSDDSSIYADAKHKWKVNKGILTTEEIYKSSKDNLSIETTNQIQGNYIDLPINPYVLGVWLIIGDRKAILNTSNHKVLSRINERGYLISNLSTNRDYEIIGLKDKLPKRYIIPKQYLRSSIEQRKEIIRAINDLTSSNTLVFKSESIPSIRELYHSLGYITHVRILDKDYEELTVIDKAYRLINTITPQPSTPVKCISVDREDGMFLAGVNFIPTHNSTIASIIALKEFYDLISLAHPAAHYGLIPNEPIGIFVMAQSHEQVKDTLFGKIRGYVKDSEFFSSLEQSGKIQILTDAIRYPSKNIAIYAKHTNSSALVGYNLKCLIIDEVARFQNKVEVDGSITSLADEIWGNIGRGVQRFGDEGRKVAISSAWCEEDPILKLWNISKSDPHTLGFRLRSWDINKRPEASRIACESDYIADRNKAELEYEGIRRKKSGTFITDNMLNKCKIGNSCIDINEVNRDLTTGGGTRYYVELDITRLESDKNIESFIHIDFSTKRDATGLCICHPVLITPQEDEDEEFDIGPQWGIQVDGILKWTPYMDQAGYRRVVSYMNIERVLLELCEKRNVKKVTFDCYNSETTIQKLHSLGINTQETAVDRNSQLDYYTTTRDLMTQGLLILPIDSVYISQLQSELTHLIVKPNGSITHDIRGKDLSDALVNSLFQCYRYMTTTGKSLGINPSITINEANYRKKMRRTGPINIGSRLKKVHYMRGRNRL